MADNPSIVDVYKVLLDVKEDMGHVKAGISANADHTTAVSKKVDVVRSELQAHAGDDGAHGLGTVAKVEAKVEAKDGMTFQRAVAYIAGLELLAHTLGPWLAASFHVGPKP